MASPGPPAASSRAAGSAQGWLRAPPVPFVAGAEAIGRQSRRHRGGGSDDLERSRHSCLGRAGSPVCSLHLGSGEPFAGGGSTQSPRYKAELPGLPLLRTEPPASPDGEERRPVCFPNACQVGTQHLWPKLTPRPPAREGGAEDRDAGVPLSEPSLLPPRPTRGDILAEVSWTLRAPVPVPTSRMSAWGHP